MDDIELSVISVISRIVEEMLSDPAARVRVLNYLSERYVEPVPEWEGGAVQSTVPGSGASVASGWGWG
jgi:hypothetical protein